MKITFNKFEEIMNHVVAFEELQDKMISASRDYNDATNDFSTFDIPATVTDTVSMLSLLLDDTENWISYWVWELDCGKGYTEGAVTTEDGANIPLKTIKDLWNLLNEERNGLHNGIKQDLFTVPQGYYLAHCISGDYALGAGIAKKFDEVYNMRFKLHKNYPIPDGEKFTNVGKALLVDNVFNLVTKDRCYYKPTYDILRKTLEDMKEQCIAHDIDRIAMPKIGSGLDKLDWNVVRDIINDVFGNSDIDVLICCL